jgi:Tfp pilus assembly protein PilN
MIKINLLAPEAIAKEERSEFLLIGWVIVILAVLAGTANYTAKFLALKKLQARVTVANQELVRYEDIVKQVEALEATKKVLETKKNVMNALMTTRLFYPRFMEDLMMILPRNVWLKTINTKIDPSTGKMAITMTADALDNFSIADFVSELIADGDYTDVELGPISAQGGKVPSSAFQLTFNYLKKAQEIKK